MNIENNTSEKKTWKRFLLSTSGYCDRDTLLTVSFSLIFALVYLLIRVAYEHHNLKNHSFSTSTSLMVHDSPAEFLRQIYGAIDEINNVREEEREKSLLFIKELADQYNKKMQHIQQPTEFQENEGNELNSEFEDTINSANQKSEEEPDNFTYAEATPASTVIRDSHSKSLDMLFYGAFSSFVLIQAFKVFDGINIGVLIKCLGITSVGCVIISLVLILLEINTFDIIPVTAAILTSIFSMERLRRATFMVITLCCMLYLACDVQIVFFGESQYNKVQMTVQMLVEVVVVFCSTICVLNLQS